MTVRRRGRDQVTETGHKRVEAQTLSVSRSLSPKLCGYCRADAGAGQFLPQIAELRAQTRSRSQV